MLKQQVIPHKNTLTHFCYHVLLITSISISTITYSVEKKAPENHQIIIQVPSRSSRLLNLKKGEKVIAASEPNIAIIEQLSDEKLLIRGMSTLGTTNIVLLDKKNNLSRTVTIEVTQNLDSLKKKLYQMLPNEAIKVSNAHGKIVLAGQVSNLANMDIALRLAQAYTTSSSSGSQSGNTTNNASSNSSSNTGTNSNSISNPNVINMMQVGGGQQVTLEVKIAEVSRTLTRKLGISRDISNNHQRGGNDFIWSALSTAASVFTGSYLTGEVLFRWTIDFSKETGLATLLAEPNLTTLSGQKAAFLSGGEFPYQVCNTQGNQFGGVICTVGFKQYGVGLEFLPTVLDSHKINLNTHVSVSTLNNKAAEITGVSTSTPSLSVREAQTTIELGDGQSMSIAGLLSDDSNGNQSQVPGFADIPLVGTLFRNRSSTAEKKELIILVTPHLAQPVPKSQMRLPTEAFVPPDDVDFYLLGKMEARTSKPLQPDNSNNVGVNGQFGHQVNEGGQ
jgi:pilus assembly protein CpaC